MITRKIDRSDGLAGFTYNWVKKMSTHLDKLYVICLEKGDTSNLPENIRVHSLGKELGKGRLMLRMEDTRSVAGWIGGQELLLDRIRTVDEVVSILDTVSSEDLQRIAQEIFSTDRLCFVMVGPSRKEKRLEKLLSL